MSTTAIPDRFTTLPDERALQATVVALEEHGFSVEVVGDLDAARRAVLARIPEGSSVMTNTSVTLDQTGLADAINDGGGRWAYKIAEEKDLEGWVVAFTEDGTFTDKSIGVTWQGPAELPQQVENYHRAFPDMHRELIRFYSTGDIVVVQLALQGTHLGPLHLPERLGQALHQDRRLRADIVEL